MIVLFHAICFIFTELSTPVWQKEARQVTYQLVEAMREAEKTLKGSNEPLVQEYFMLRSIELGDQILLFSRFLLLASLRYLMWLKNNLQRVD